jgi:hypothetical protein
MWTRTKHSSAVLLGGLAAAAMLTSCSPDMPTGASDELPAADAASSAGIAVCQRSGSSGTIVTVPRSELAARLRRGDYLTSLAVSHAGDQPHDGAHFQRIGDALAAVRAGRLARSELRSAACRVTITVAPGLYQGSSAETGDKDIEVFPLVVDVPDVTLLGALVMQLDASGRATGLSATHRRTALETAPGVEDASTIILANGHPRGSAGHGLTVEGFAMQAPAGYAVFSIRVRRLVIRGNRFEGGFGVTLDLRATDALVERNQVKGTNLCDMCLAGPGVYRVRDNRLLTGAIEGILVAPAVDPTFASPFEVEPSDMPAAAEVSAEITNNEVRDHREFPGSAGIRMAGIGVGTADVRGSTHVTAHGNVLVNNTFGVMVEAGFPAPDTRLRSDMDVTLGGNTIERSCQADLYVTFERHSRSPEPGDLFLKHTTYRLALGGDVRFRDAWFSNPVGFGNTLVVDGRTIGHGTRQPFDELTCPARREGASSATAD